MKRRICLKIVSLFTVFLVITSTGIRSSIAADDQPFLSEEWFLAQPEKLYESGKEKLLDVGSKAVKDLCMNLAGKALDAWLPGASALLGLAGGADPFSALAEKILKRIDQLEETIIDKIEAKDEEGRVVKLSSIEYSLTTWNNRSFGQKVLFRDDLKRDVIEPLIDLAAAYAYTVESEPVYGTRGLHKKVTVTGILLPLLAELMALDWYITEEAGNDNGEVTLEERILQEWRSILVIGNSTPSMFEHVRELGFREEFDELWDCKYKELENHHPMGCECSWNSLQSRNEKYTCDYRGRQIIFQRQRNWEDVCWEMGYLANDTLYYDKNRYPYLQDVKNIESLKHAIIEAEWDNFVIETYGSVRYILDKWWRTAQKSQPRYLDIDDELDAAVLLTQLTSYSTIEEMIEYYVSQIARDPWSLDIYDERRLVNYIIMHGYDNLADTMGQMRAGFKYYDWDPMAYAEGGPLLDDLMRTFEDELSLSEMENLYKGQFAAKVVAVVF